MEKNIVEVSFRLRVTPENKRNLAKVHYEKQDDGNFRIVALENFLSREEITSRYGAGVEVRYLSQDHAMWKKARESIGGENSVFLKTAIFGGLFEGYVYTKEVFTGLIAEAKICGAALSRIIKEVKNSTKVIEI